MDCLDGMKLLDDNSVDSIVTDPPYEWGFMGEKWDMTGIAYNIELWQECLRVLKPGGHLLAFGGTRTYHRMACAIEDAGFEIRDQMQWIYGSGFPKSHDISKAFDKRAGAERHDAIKGGHMGISQYGGDARNSNADTYYMKVPPIIGKGAISKGTPVTDLAKKWDGWGTALKPAHEPIVLARKPLSEKTIADNVLKWGTGGLNIDGCRVETNGETPKGSGKGSKNSIFGQVENIKGNDGNVTPELGRFPANLILDEEAGKMLDEQSGISKSSGSGYNFETSNNDNPVRLINNIKSGLHFNDSGGASRFFYVAKASKKERGEGNNHPTVKPVKLMEYLITLVTPPNGIVLDPFFGSGTTGIAAVNLGFNYIGFEISKEYCIIAEKRISQMKRAIKRVERIG